MGTRLCIVEGLGVTDREKTIWVFRARSREDAIRRFIELVGEEKYMNAYGERVRWALTSVETLDELGDGEFVNREVFSELRPLKRPDRSIAINARFRPAASEPEVTAVGVDLVKLATRGRRNRSRKPSEQTAKPGAAGKGSRRGTRS
jgi:hypothetical protein